MGLDVTSLNHRRAVHRWERVSVGDVLERLTWSYPDKEAIVGWPGGYAHPEHARLTYRQADELTASDRLAGFETPKDVIFADALPETVGGKVLKYRLRAAHASHYA